MKNIVFVTLKMVLPMMLFIHFPSHNKKFNKESISKSPSNNILLLGYHSTFFTAFPLYKLHSIPVTKSWSKAHTLIYLSTIEVQGYWTKVARSSKKSSNYSFVPLWGLILIFVCVLAAQKPVGKASLKFKIVCQRIWKNNSRDSKKIWLH